VADHRFASAPLPESAQFGPLAARELLARLTPGLADPSRSAPRSAALTGERGPWVTDALDYFGTWKLLDGLVDAAFRGVHREYALGDTYEQRYMGEWSDRVPVRTLIVERP
jgi:hypothetical protein